MVLGRVVGTVVSTQKVEVIEGVKFLLIEKLDPATMAGKKDYVVAMDAVGSGPGEVVFYVTGSSSRYTPVTTGRASDATVIAIVDQVELAGKTVFRKGSA